jgi:transglutaminase-like putative cysteine protease
VGRVFVDSKIPDAVPSKRYKVEHVTRYRYQFPVALSYHMLHLEPRSWSMIQDVSDFQIRISPNPTDFTHGQDFFGNPVQSFSVQETYSELVVDTEFYAKVVSEVPPIEDMTINCDQVRKALHGNTTFQNLQALQYIYPSPLVPHFSEIEQWSASFFDDKSPFIAGVLALSKELKATIEFDPQATHITTSVDEFFREKKGVCQDFAHLMIACIRATICLPAMSADTF